MTCRIRWASWGLFAGSLLASAVGCMGTGAGTGGGWPGLSWMRWGRPDPAAVAAKDNLAPPSVTNQPDYPKTEQAAISSPGAPAAAANVASTGNPYPTGQYALGANAAANPAAPEAAPSNQGFYNTEYNAGGQPAAGQPAAGQPANAYAAAPGGYPQAGLGQQPPAQPYPAYNAGGYADNNASPASYQPQTDPAAAAYAQANANAAAQYQPQQPQPSYDPNAANPAAAGGYAAQPSADALAAFAASAGANPPMNPGAMNPGPAGEGYYAQPAANAQPNAYAQPAGYAANPQAPTSPEGGATGFIEDNAAAANPAQPGGYAAQPGAYPAQPSPYAANPSPETATGRAILPNQLPPVNPAAGLTGMPQHRADPRYRPGSARDFFPAGGSDAANTADGNATPGVRPATFYR